jgi:hypothetical protein
MPKLILPTILFAALAAAQTLPAPSAPTNQDQAQPATSVAASPLAAGAAIPAELSKSLDAKKNKMGDKVEAKTTVDLLSHGQIVLPRNTKIVGHVTSVKTRSKDSQQSAVEITFDHILFKDGHQLPIQVAVQAIGRPLQNFPATSDSRGENAANVSTTMPAGADAAGTPTGGPMSPGSMSGHPPYPGVPNSPAPDTPGLGNPPTGTTIAALGPTSQGAVGLKGISLTSSGQAATISSTTQNVHLDGGSQLILKTQ